MQEGAFAIHEKRVEKYNTEAESFLSLITQAEEEPRPQGPSEYVAVATFGADVLEGSIRLQPDGQGRIIARHFVSGGKLYGLEDEAHQQFVGFAQRLQAEWGIQQYVSVIALEDSVFKWITERLLRKFQGSVWEYLEEHLRPTIAEQVVDIPIAELWVQRPIAIGRVVFAPITPQIVRGWFPQLGWNLDENERAKYEALAHGEWVRYQGLCYAKAKIFAEPQHAKNVAYNYTEDALSLLSFYSPASIIPHAVFAAAPYGYENIKLENCFVYANNGHFHGFHGQTDRRDHRIQFDAESLAYMEQQSPLGALNAFYCKENRTKFDGEILDSFLLFLRHTRARTLSEKVIFIFVALDSLLLTDDKEGIQSNIGRRIGFAIGEKPSDRKRIDRTIKAAYKIRSDYIHHAVTLAEEQVVSDLLAIAMQLYLELVRISGDWKNRHDYIRELDDKLWGVAEPEAEESDTPESSVS